MRIGLVSDIHGNLPALRATLDALGGVDAIVCPGDLTGYYTEPNRVISTVLDSGMRFIIGNHDWYLDDPPSDPNALLRESIEFARSRVSPEYRRLLADSPKHMELECDGSRVAVYHGSPWDHLEEYVYPDYTHFERFEEVDADVIVLGHTHHPIVRRMGDRLLINPGSCGQPRDGDPRAACAVLDTRERTCEIVRVQYDTEPVIAGLREHGLDMRLAKYFAL